MSSKKSKKQNVKSKSRATKKPTTKSNKKNNKKKPSKNTKLPKTSHLKVDTTKLHSSDDDIAHHRRTKSPLSPFTDWYKSHKKKSKPKSKFNRQRSQSNKFYGPSASKYKRKKSKDKSQPKPHTPRNTESKYKKNRNKSPPEGDHKKQLKFTRKNDKITVDLNHNSKKQSMSPKLSKKTKNKRKHINISPPTNTISISQLSKSANNSPKKQSKSRKSTSKKKRQSFAKRASFKLKKTRSHSANPPNAKDRKKSSKRGSFFSISRDKKLKNQNAIREREKKKKPKKKKSLKERIGRKSKNKNNKKHTIDENMIFIGNDYENYDNDMHHEARSSLNVHKLRMTAKALREEMDDEYNDDLLGGNTIKLLNDRDDSSSVSSHNNSHTQYTTTIKFKNSDSNSRKGMHHKRGSSGIPHFFQKKLAFELGQYVDEKARLFISYYCRLYGLRIIEQLFDIISRFHVMPFDSGFICMTSKDPANDDDKYETFTNVTYHSPLIQTPMALMSGLLGVTDGITDDRLSALLEQSDLLKQQSVPVRAQSMPPPVSFRTASKSFDHVNQRKGTKKVNFAETTPITETKKTSSAEYISLRQSQSVVAYQTDEELFCDDIDIDDISRKKEADLMKIKKYKKKASQKRNKKLKRSTTYDKTKKHKKKIKSKVTPKIFYSSASELSEDEHPSFEDIDLSAEANDGFPDINYTELLQENSLQNPILSQSDNSVNIIEQPVEYSHTLSINKLFNKTTPLYEDTNTTFSPFNTVTTHTNDTPNTITNNNKVTELCTDYSPPPSPKGYRSDDTMTPRSPTVTNDKFIYSEEFKISFDEHDMQIISNENKINKMKKEWIGTNENINGVGIAEWTILSNPKVFNYHNNPKNKQTVNDMTQHIGMGLGLGFGIGGFIDRTRGVCDVSLAPVYYRYGGQDINNGYYNKLDMYNLYTGDYIQSCSKLPFNGLYDTCSSIVREGYKSTLIITGGQYYGQEIFDDNMIQSKTYFYTPWINSNYHHQISEYGLNNGFIDKHNIVNTNSNNNSRNQSRRNSITDITPINNTNPIQENNIVNKKRLSNIINFNNIPTRTLRSISITHSYRSRDDKLKKQTTNTGTPSISTNTNTNLNDIPSLATYESNTITIDDTITTSDSSMLTTRKDINIKNKLLGDGNWIVGPSMITPRASHGSVSWDEHIIFCCGGIGSTGRRISNVEMLRMDKFKQLEDINKLRWRKCESMSANKSNLVLIHWKPKTCIVSVGSGSKVVESYDPYKDNWKDLPPLNTHQISSKSCRFYYDTQSNNNCLIFIKFRNGIVKSMEYLDERKKLKKWTNIKDQYVELFNAQINQSNHNNNQTYLKNIKTFCFS